MFKKLKNPYEGARYQKYAKQKQELQREHFLLMRERQNMTGPIPDQAQLPSQHTILEKNYSEQSEQEQQNANNVYSSENIIQQSPPTFEVDHRQKSSKLSSRNKRREENQQKIRNFTMSDDIIQIIEDIQRKACTQIENLRADKIHLMKRLNEEIRNNNAEKRKRIKMQNKFNSLSHQFKNTNQQYEPAIVQATIYEQQEENSPSPRQVSGRRQKNKNQNAQHRQSSFRKQSARQENIPQERNQYPQQSSHQMLQQSQQYKSQHPEQYPPLPWQKQQPIRQQYRPPQYPPASQYPLQEPQQHSRLQQNYAPQLNENQNSTQPLVRRSQNTQQIFDQKVPHSQSVYYINKGTKGNNAEVDPNLQNQILRLRQQNLQMKNVLSRNNSQNSSFMKNKLQNQLRDLSSKLSYYEQVIKHKTIPTFDDTQFDGLLAEGANIAEQGRRLIKVKSNPEFKSAAQIVNYSGKNGYQNNENSLFRGIRTQFDQEQVERQLIQPNRQNPRNNNPRFTSEDYERLIQTMNQVTYN